MPIRFQDVILWSKKAVRNLLCKLILKAIGISFFKDDEVGSFSCDYLSVFMHWKQLEDEYYTVKNGEWAAVLTRDYSLNGEDDWGADWYVNGNLVEERAYDSAPETELGIVNTNRIRDNPDTVYAVLAELSAFASFLPDPAEEGRRKATEELLSAVKNAGVEEVTRLIQEGAYVNATDKDRMTPLMLAVINDANPEVLEILIKNGAHVNATDKDRMTPLMLAVINNANPEVLEILIKNGAHVDNAALRRGRYRGWTLLALAAAKSSYPETLQILIDKGAQVDLGGSDGTTP